MRGKVNLRLCSLAGVGFNAFESLIDVGIPVLLQHHKFFFALYELQIEVDVAVVQLRGGYCYYVLQVGNTTGVLVPGTVYVILFIDLVIHRKWSWRFSPEWRRRTEFLRPLETTGQLVSIERADRVYTIYTMYTVYTMYIIYTIYHVYHIYHVYRIYHIYHIPCIPCKPYIPYNKAKTRGKC